MKIIFDLDYTLLDTKRLRAKLAEIFDKEDFLEDHQKYFKDKKINLNLETYLAILKDQDRIDERREEELKLRLADLLSRLDEYLFPGAEKILRHFKEQGVELILLTFGDKKWQADKVNNLSIKKYFAEIIFEDKNKHNNPYWRSLNSSAETILIVNDKARETQEIIKIIGANAKVFLVDGPYARNIKHNWPIHRLEELINYKL